MALAAVGSLAIGLSPNYALIGVGASIILVLARLAQGLAHGGELPSAQTYIAEAAPRERRGLWSSLIYFSGTIGQLAGTLLAAILSTALTKEAMNSYGWRIPFISMFPNATSMTPAADPDAVLIPWTAIVVVLLLLALLWAIWVRVRRWSRRRADPVAASWEVPTARRGWFGR